MQVQEQPEATPRMYRANVGDELDQEAQEYLPVVGH
jgi:hypothetical protein